ncbi:MAG: 2-oxoglutarate dehydrogenase E1 component [Bdellovibrionota bacterium]
MVNDQTFAHFGTNSGYIKDLYRLYATDRKLVEETWALYFDSLETNGNLGLAATSNGHTLSSATEITGDIKAYALAASLIDSYRAYGHYEANFNPVNRGIEKYPKVDELSQTSMLDSLGDSSVSCLGFQRQSQMPANKLSKELRKIFCGSIGIEYLHIAEADRREWIQDRFENRFNDGSGFDTTARLRQLQTLVNSEEFEGLLHTRYVGHKRFSLQGGETLIPVLDTVLNYGSELGLKGLIVGMAHRGRLNVLANTLGKPLKNIFSEFEDQNVTTVLGSGDVKYHMGYRSFHHSATGEKLELMLAPNPSHLEFVDPVVVGIARAKQDLEFNRNRQLVLPLLIHGDSAFIGQGVVTETLNMAEVQAHNAGGTLHVIVNNQVGFTADPDEYRSSAYCTAFAKAIGAPILHVNAEDVEECCWAAKLVLEYRMKYGTDVVLDLYCYRKYGHNEGDDPSFTQPILYQEIKSKKPISTIYADQLLAKGEITANQISDYKDHYKLVFDAAADAAEAATPIGEVCETIGRFKLPTPETGVEREKLEQIAASMINYPDNFKPHPKLSKILEKRVQTLTDGEGIDWGFAEGLSFGSLILEGKNVRLSGQDCGRGTFSQRHLLLTSYDGQGRYMPLDNLGPETGTFEVYNSVLSEAAVLGFEFGYSSIAKNDLVLWEAQFGDFVNGAQVIIDQFISASEQKWNQLSGIVLLLPHGYEGQGPEHSSARLERFLQLCADGNMVVCYPSNAAQHFHLLRTQGKLEIKRPLIVMTPKSLLRHPGAACSIDDLTSGSFQPCLVNKFGNGDKSIVFTSGKIFYELEQALKDSNSNATIVRIEQLYPFPNSKIEDLLTQIDWSSAYWVQEEPQNMGSWTFIKPYLEKVLGDGVTYIGRNPSASTATGSGKAHAFEQQSIIDALIAELAR